MGLNIFESFARAFGRGPRMHRELVSAVEQLHRTLFDLPNDLTRYNFLMHILHFDPDLFFAAIRHDIPKTLPLIYTPLVGAACQHYSELKVPPRGLHLRISDAGSIRDRLAQLPKDSVDVIVVTDGERILGLGDLGANGHGIPVGKLLLYSACGGVEPSKCLPVTLDAGCNTESVTGYSEYIGLKQPRVRGEAYDRFVDEFIKAAVDRFGARCLIQFEDFGNANALRLLEKYRDSVCTFNDDIQGTAAVALAGLFSALRINGVNKNLAEHCFLFLGAGSAGIGIASLLVLELSRQGIPEEKARKICWFVDSKGLVYDGRRNVSSAKAPFAHKADSELIEASSKGFEAVVRHLKPTGIIGVSTSPGAFDTGVLSAMAENNRRPIVFALSNPSSKSECTAEAAYAETNGSAVFASGSPFAPVTLPDGSKRVPGQGNNAYVFPGLGMGVVASGSKLVSDEMLLIAAKTLADLVSSESLGNVCLYPPLENLLDVSAHIAFAVAQEAARSGLAERDGLTLDAIRAKMYDPWKVSLV